MTLAQEKSILEGMFHSKAKLKAIGKAFGTPLKLELSKEKSGNIILAEVGSDCAQAQTSADHWAMSKLMGFPGSAVDMTQS